MYWLRVRLANTQINHTHQVTCENTDQTLTLQETSRNILDMKAEYESRVGTFLISNF